MAEIVGLIIGTSGLITVAQVCLKAAHIIEVMKTFREETSTLYAVYRFEQARLSLWITQVLRVSVTTEQLQNLSLTDIEIPTILTDESPIDLRVPLQTALNEIKKILTHVATLLTKYGASDISLRSRAGFWTKIYKEGGKEAIQALLTEFKNWNDGLDGIVESRLRNTLIARMQVHVLALADTPQQLAIIEIASETLYPAISTEASFRRRLLDIRYQQAGTELNLRVPPDDVNPRDAPRTINGKLKMRRYGRLTTSNGSSILVLQEWKFGQPTWTDSQITIALERANNLALALHLDKKPKQLRCLDLVNHTTVDTRSGQNDKTRLDFCFMYKLPTFANESSEPVTLLDALDLPDKLRPTLAERYMVAVTIAQSILEFHVHDWLHKAIWSNNILFFRDKRGNQLAFSEPFIAGFEFARRDTPKDETIEDIPIDKLTKGGGWGSDFGAYRHPDFRTENEASARPRYQRQYDIYGLGMTLLEIGCWRPMVVYLKKKPDNRTNDQWFLKVCREHLPSQMGTKYRDIVSKCLEWPPDVEKSLSGPADTDEGKRARSEQIEEFMISVVNALQGCHCRS